MLCRWASKLLLLYDELLLAYYYRRIRRSGLGPKCEFRMTVPRARKREIGLSVANTQIWMQEWKSITFTPLSLGVVSIKFLGEPAVAAEYVAKFELYFYILIFS